MSRDLEALHEEIRSCTRCRLSETRMHAVPGEGPEESRILCIGEAPGKREDEEGRPFVGRAGTELDTLLDLIDLARSEVYITSVVKCRPPENRDPAQEEIEACLPYLQEQIALLDPGFIVPMGRYATWVIFRLFGLETRQISDLHGRARRVTDRGRQRVLLPTYHPAVVMHNPNLRDALNQDFQVLKDLLGDSS
ncbi:MAG: uracil-DNA glycosylase [Methanomicrobiaceae archaeon]|nr:uracil-DNA glycosylase [Methanomicrobiaceae archaeon]